MHWRTALSNGDEQIIVSFDAANRRTLAQPSTSYLGVQIAFEAVETRTELVSVIGPPSEKGVILPLFNPQKMDNIKTLWDVRR